MTVTGLQVVHAALRRRKPVIVIDPSADAAIAGALSAACTATGTRLRDGRGRESRAGGAGALGRAAPGPARPEVAVRACAAVGALGRNLRRIGVDGDGLVWIPGCDSLPAAALVPLISAGGAVGLPVLMTTTSAAAARELAGLVGVVLIHRLADPSAAAGLAGLVGLAALAGPRRRPAPLGAGEFVLAVNAPRRRQVERGRLVPARLPRPGGAPAAHVAKAPL